MTKQNKRNNMKHEFNELSIKDYLKLLNEMEKAAREIGYFEEDDEFDYDFNPAEHYETISTFD